MTLLTLANYQKAFTNSLLSESSIRTESTDLLTHIIPRFTDTEDFSRSKTFSGSNALSESLDRFNIYKNNVLYSLSRAIADTFPVIKKLVGEDCFFAAAIEFVRKKPPVHSSLLFYGEEFVEFIKTYPSCRDLVYLSDVAKLEWTYIKAFHAEDKPSLNISVLNNISLDKLCDLRLIAHPSVHLICSPWPVAHIWQENLKDEYSTIDLNQHKTNFLLIYRKELRVLVIELSEVCYIFLNELVSGKSISQAWQNTLLLQQSQQQAAIDESDLTGILKYLMSLSLFTEVQF